jgi:hypothetical protein
MMLAAVQPALIDTGTKSDDLKDVTLLRALRYVADPYNTRSL